MGLLDQIGGDLTAFMNSPITKQLLPVVAGAAGSALTSPRGTGVRAQVGRALLGGEQGYEESQQSQHQALEDQEANAKLAETQAHVAQMKRLAQNDAAWDKYIVNYSGKLPADKRDQFKAMAAVADTPDARASVIKRYAVDTQRPTAVKWLAAKTGLPADYLGAMPDDQFDSLMIDIAKHGSEYSVGRAINTPKRGHDSGDKQARPSDRKMISLGTSEVSPTSRPEYEPVPLASGNVGAFNKRTGGTADTGVAERAPGGGGAGGNKLDPETKAGFKEYQRRLAARARVHEANIKNTAGMDPETAAAITEKEPYPDVEGVGYDDWAASDAGKGYLGSLPGELRGARSSAGGLGPGRTRVCTSEGGPTTAH